LTAALLAAVASCVAWRAVSALLRTVAFICSMDAAVSCRLLACCSVRVDRSALPVAIWSLPVAMLSLPWRTSLTMRTRLSFMALSAPCNSPSSSRRLTEMTELRSPAATVRATFTASRIGPAIERVMSSASARAARTAAAPAPISRLRFNA
jgi:hypothetical protein